MIAKEGKPNQPDKMLRHLRRVAYLRERLGRVITPWGHKDIDHVKGMLIVDSPQPINFYAHEKLLDGASIYAEQISSFDFENPQSNGARQEVNNG
jgi:hypothetical protein